MEPTPCRTFEILLVIERVYHNKDRLAELYGGGCWGVSLKLEVPCMLRQKDTCTSSFMHRTFGIPLAFSPCSSLWGVSSEQITLTLEKARAPAAEHPSHGDSDPIVDLCHGTALTN